MKCLGISYMYDIQTIYDVYTYTHWHHTRMIYKPYMIYTHMHIDIISWYLELNFIYIVCIYINFTYFVILSHVVCYSHKTFSIKYRWIQMKHQIFKFVLSVIGYSSLKFSLMLNYWADPCRISYSYKQIEHAIIFKLLQYLLHIW